MLMANTHDGATSRPLLEIEELEVAFAKDGGQQKVICGMSLAIRAGEIVALVGESGSGKSMTALSTVQLLPPGASIMGGRIGFDGRNLLDCSPRELNAIRGGRIAMLFQQPHAMLDPTCRVGVQVSEALRIHRGASRHTAETRALELLREVGIPEPALRAKAYAHELSGGMAQRVMIAAALSGDPDLLIADEPTTALDVTVQAQILDLLNEQRRRRGLAILLITHDLSVVSAIADRIAVMYAGRIVEEGPKDAVLHDPQHPYTHALMHCSTLEVGPDGKLISIPSGATRAMDLDHGCRFHPRCAVAEELGIADQCHRSEPALVPSHRGDGKVRCWAAEARLAAPAKDILQ